MKTIITSRQVDLIIRRMAHQIVEENPDADKLHVIGIQPRGIMLSTRLVDQLNQLYAKPVAYGQIDITFYRDDIRRELMIPNETRIPFNVDGQRVLLVDDVLYTGRTIRSALDALIDFGRPSKVELCVLIDRQFNREIPIQPDFTGLAIDTIFSQDVRVFWKDRDGKDEVVLLEEKGS